VEVKEQNGEFGKVLHDNIEDLGYIEELRKISALRNAKWWRGCLPCAKESNTVVERPKCVFRNLV
jgi:hypothetical protein